LHCLSHLLHTAWVAASSNDDCETNDEFVEAFNDEDDIVSAADVLENNELLPLFISSQFFYFSMWRGSLYRTVV
jgi:hypothetical protein